MAINWIGKGHCLQHGSSCSDMICAFHPTKIALVMRKNIRLMCLGLLSCYAQLLPAQNFTLPVRLDYPLLKKALMSQLYTGENNTAKLWQDKPGCSFLTLSDLKIAGNTGQIQLLNNVQAQFGTAIGGQCMTLVKWVGILETWQQPTLSSDHKTLSLPVTKMLAYDPQGRQMNIGQLQNVLQSVASPKLAELKIDLQKSRGDIERSLLPYLPKKNRDDLGRLLNTLSFSRAEVDDTGVAMALSFEAPVMVKDKSVSPAFSESEQKQWQLAWHHWDQWLTQTIQQASVDSQSPGLQASLTEILHDSRQAFQTAIKEQGRNGDDPVRTFFMSSWERLAPQLQTLAKQLPEAQGLRYLTFIAATDVIYQLETLGTPLGIEISSDGLRRLGRLLLTAQQEQQHSAK